MAIDYLCEAQLTPSEPKRLSYAEREEYRTREFEKAIKRCADWCVLKFGIHKYCDTEQKMDEVELFVNKITQAIKFLDELTEGGCNMDHAEDMLKEARQLYETINEYKQ